MRLLEIKPTHVEGLNRGEWVLMDYIDIVVHVFTEQKREFYRLERLWGDAPRLDLSELEPALPPPAIPDTSR